MFIFYLIIGALAGVLGGMGMGGGTILIPLFVLFLKMSQHQAQFLNLISFVPMAVVAILLHLQNKLIKKDNLLFIILPACIFGALSAFFARNIEGNTLKVLFGIYLIIMGIIQIILTAVSKKENNRY